MLSKLTLEQAARGVQSGEWTVPEIVEDTLSRALGRGAELNAFVSVFAEYARSLAAQYQTSDARPLSGVPLSVKDDLFSAGLRTTAGSPLLSEFVPTTDCPAVARLKQAGAIIFGKTNLSDFAMSLASGSTLTGLCRNPWDASRSAGASSCGAASAVGAGIGAVAVATDSGGSIRYPAALCGVLGFAPSNGRVPKQGSFGANHLFCSVGVLARDVRDIAKVLSVMSGPDASDTETWRYPQQLLPSEVTSIGSSMRIGVLATGTPASQRGREIDTLFSQMTLSLAKELKWTLDAADIDTVAAYEALRVISDCDRLALMTRSGILGVANEELLPQALQARFANARSLTGADYSNAMAERAVFCGNLEKLFEAHDLLVGLTFPDVAPPLDSQEQPALHLAWTNFAGCPAASVPLGLIEGLPVGLHLVARPGNDALVLRACAELQAILAPDGFSAAPGS